MGGAIEGAVEKCGTGPARDLPQHGRQRPRRADLVVTDPVQAGVMAVMAVAETARFNIERLKRRVF